MLRKVVLQQRRLKNLTSLRQRAEPMASRFDSPGALGVTQTAWGSRSSSSAYLQCDETLPESDSVPTPPSPPGCASSSSSPQLYDLNPTIGRVVARNLVHALNVVSEATHEDNNIKAYSEPWVDTCDGNTTYSQSDKDDYALLVQQVPIVLSETETSTPVSAPNEPSTGGGAERPSPHVDHVSTVRMDECIVEKKKVSKERIIATPVDTPAKRPVARPRHGTNEQHRQTPKRSTKAMETAIVIAMRDGNPERARRFFYESCVLGQNVDIAIVRDLFHVLIPLDPLDAYSVLNRYRQLLNLRTSTDPDESNLLQMYRSMCVAIRHTNMKRNSSERFSKVFRQLKNDLANLGVRNFQRVCYPLLLVNLAQMSVPGLRSEVKDLYEYMTHQKFDLSPEILEQLLTSCTVNHHHELPYAHFLSLLIEKGYKPAPQVAISVLANLFPFSNLGATRRALKAIIDLQAVADPDDDVGDYCVDMGTLEQITAAAARNGDYEVNLLVWDLMDMLRYEPSEAVYENTIHAFSMTYRQDHSVFSVLGEMESKGFVPSRALISSISRSLCFSAGRVDNAYHLLTDGRVDGATVSVFSLNVILSACAGLPDVDRAFATLDEFKSYGLEPNVDTYSYLLEALTRSLSADIQKDEGEKIAERAANQDASESIVNMMEEKGLRLSSHCIEQHVLLLCHVGKTDAAAEFLFSRLDRGEEASNKTILLLATACAEEKEYDVALQVVSHASEHPSFLQSRVMTWKRQATHGSQQA